VICVMRCGGLSESISMIFLEGFRSLVYAAMVCS
jgi:hypothetical protein